MLTSLADDRSGQTLVDRIAEAGHRLAARDIVRDDRNLIREQVLAWSEDSAIDVVITTGGTGFTGRDVTPEATAAVCDRLLPGFGEVMRIASLAEVPTAILSRQIAGSRGQSLIVNLPGKPSSIGTCLDAVFAAIPYCIDLIGGPRLETHPEKCRAFRPAT